MKKVLIVCLLLFQIAIAQAVTKTTAKIDTCICWNNDITCIYTLYQKNTKGQTTIKHYAKYVNDDQNVCDLITLPKNVYDYIILCYQTNVHAYLGIVFKNNTPQRIVKYRKAGVSYKGDTLKNVQFYKSKNYGTN